MQYQKHGLSMALTLIQLQVTSQLDAQAQMSENYVHLCVSMCVSLCMDSYSQSLRLLPKSLGDRRCDIVLSYGEPQTWLILFNLSLPAHTLSLVQTMFHGERSKQWETTPNETPLNTFLNERIKTALPLNSTPPFSLLLPAPLSSPLSYGGLPRGSPLERSTFCHELC